MDGPTWTQVTLDGINIQDNFIRINSLDFLPNRPTSDNVAEFSITTSVAGADTAGGATTIRMVTPSGTNTFRGSVFEFNRDSKFSANQFFNNSSGVEKPALSRNQFGGRLGGPIVRNKLFFFGNYEGFRQKEQTPQNITIPANADFCRRRVPLRGAGRLVRSINVMQLAGLPIDPKLRVGVPLQFPAASNVNNYDLGNSRADRVLNTAGYRFNQNLLNNRDQFDLRFDYAATDRHRFEGVVQSLQGDRRPRRPRQRRTDRPLVYTSSDPTRYALAWRWAAATGSRTRCAAAPTWRRCSSSATGITAAASVQHQFESRQPHRRPGHGGATSGFLPQGRYTHTYQLNDTGRVTGAHDLQFGGSWQRNRVNPYNFAGQYPTATFGFSAAAPSSVQLSSGQFPGGISAADLANANAMATMLGGVVSSVTQTYQVRDETSGYVPGIPANENYTLTTRHLPAGQLAGQAELHDPRGPEIGVLQPAARGPQPRVPAGARRPIDRSGACSIRARKSPRSRTATTIGKTSTTSARLRALRGILTKDGRTAVRGGYFVHVFVNEEAMTPGRAAALGQLGPEH